MNIFEYFGYFITFAGVISVIVAFRQNWKYQSLKRINKTDSFELYVNMAFLLGDTQDCIQSLQDENTKEALLAFSQFKWRGEVVVIKYLC